MYSGIRKLSLNGLKKVKSVFVSRDVFEWGKTSVDEWEVVFLKSLVRNLKADFIAEYKSCPDMYSNGIPPMPIIKDGVLYCPRCSSVVEELLYRVEIIDPKTSKYVFDLYDSEITKRDRKRCNLSEKIRESVRYDECIPSIEDIMGEEM